MIKTKVVRFVELNGVRWQESLWEPDRGDSDLDKPEWRKDETSQPSVSDFSALQVGTVWPFPESST